MISKDELDLVDTDELVAALRRRSEGSVIVLLHDVSQENEAVQIMINGGETIALGLIHRVRAHLEQRKAKEG